MNTRWRRCIAALGVSTMLGVGVAALVNAPAQAVFPATIKICNNIETSDTNGGNTDGKNIDVDRSATSSYGTYSNELLPGDCTGNVNDPAKVTIDLTDDGANFVPDGSAMIGIAGDTFDDSQGPYDLACVDSVTATNENAVPITEALASHANTTNGVAVRIRAARNCGANLTDHIQVCNDSASVGEFDLFKLDGSDADSLLDYSQELGANECSNYKDVDGSNPLALDLYDDAARSVVEWKWRDNSVGTWSACERDKSAEDDADTVLEVGTIADFNTNDQTYTGSRTVRIYNDGTAAGTVCGVAGSPPVNEVDPSPAGLPANGEDDPAANAPTPAWVASSTPDGQNWDQ